MNFVETIEQAKRLSYALGNGYPTKLYIENFAYQESLVQILKDNCIPAEGVKIPGDKYARLSLVTHLIETGKVLFPRHGAERLIEQLTHFGIEKHDDLVDAFVYLLIKAIEPREVPLKIMPFIRGMKSHWQDLP